MGSWRAVAASRHLVSCIGSFVTALAPLLNTSSVLWIGIARQCVQGLLSRLWRLIPLPTLLTAVEYDPSSTLHGQMRKLCRMLP